ncbi:GNAT family N-acetyltransferase [Paenibacillus sp. CAU 1782]
MHKHGMYSTRQMNDVELEGVSQLAALCNQQDGIELKLNWTMLRERPGKENGDFLFYEDGKLVGFLGIYQFQSREVEISGMVHPLHRRKGIFGQLVGAARQETSSRGVPKMIFICQNGSLPGKAYLDALGTAYSFSEYWMKLEGEASEPRPSQLDIGEKLILRLVEPGDLMAIAKLNAEGFDMTEEDALKFAENSAAQASSPAFVAELRSSGGKEAKIVGKINVRLNNGQAFIYGFVVASSERGKGFGKRILRETIIAIKEMDSGASIALEVAVKNEAALGLYEGTGFVVKKSTDYYEQNT